MAVPEQVHEALGEGGFSIVYRGVYGKQQDGAALQVCMYIISCHGSTYYGRRRAAGGHVHVHAHVYHIMSWLYLLRTAPRCRWR